MKAFLEKEYGIRPLKLKLLRQLENKSYFIEAKEGNFLLRICNHHLDKKINSEILFSNHLIDHGVSVPKIIKTVLGDNVSSYEGRLTVLFEWIDGLPIGNQLTVDDALEIGKMMKEMHLVPEIALDHCIVYDDLWLFGPKSWFKVSGQSFFSVEEYNEISSILSWVSKLMKNQPLRAIHSDIHFGNVVKHRKKYAFIDFDSYAMSSLYFDLGVTYLELLDFEDERYIEAFFEGYGQVDQELLNAYIVAACMVFLEWVYTSNSVLVKESKLQYVSATLAVLFEYGKKPSHM